MKPLFQRGFATDEAYYQKILADTAVQKTVSYEWMNDPNKILKDVIEKKL